MAEPGILVPPAAGGFSLVPEALPALPGPVAFPLGPFNSSYKVSAFPLQFKEMHFHLATANQSMKFFPCSLIGRPQMEP